MEQANPPPSRYLQVTNSESLIFNFISTRFILFIIHYLLGLHPPSAGTAWIAGHNIISDMDKVFVSGSFNLLSLFSSLFLLLYTCSSDFVNMIQTGAVADWSVPSVLCLVG